MALRPTLSPAAAPRGLQVPVGHLAEEGEQEQDWEALTARARQAVRFAAAADWRPVQRHPSIRNRLHPC